MKLKLILKYFLSPYLLHDLGETYVFLYASHHPPTHCYVINESSGSLITVLHAPAIMRVHAPLHALTAHAQTLIFSEMATGENRLYSVDFLAVLGSWYHILLY